MVTNSDLTIYSRKRGAEHDEWNRQYVEEVWWFLNTKSGITTEGLKTGDIVTIRIPDLSVEVKKGDYIVQGNCDIFMKTVKDLAEKEYFCVTGANYNRFGANPHIKVVAV